MTPDVAVMVWRDAMWLIVLLVAVIVMPSLVVGLVISTFQAATQINEQTLSFLPRLLVTLVVIIATGPWLLSQILDYAERLILSIPSMVG
ncbi:flagellar biosynthesis protein FliQ [Pseudohongiella sp. SYSU M77423]|uniref:flagellar biosynthesis protein FliQ n=1 Tax=unclassified Pseudohongiella TaxID=2629611 RepID=UPI001EFFB0B4|nr:MULTISPECIES: flagellar biosynthesis protein FliQ [unclassified Pseudohongiella]MDH7942984.1 flagellar biosynthesis protein FliQ [Pseudohongiella sp. SYSU M77423]MEC8858552.1 flagellar biosynthesis protein FliQ [Pseudomonadota bacterium]